MNDGAMEVRVRGGEAVREGIWSLPMAMPDRRIGYSLGYVVADAGGDLHLIDPGWDTEQNWIELRRFLAALGYDLDDVATVVATHLHPDHLGLASRIATSSGATILMHEVEVAAALSERPRANIGVDEDRLEAWGVPHDRRESLRGPLDLAPLPAFPMGLTPLADGELLPVPGRRLESIRTPGHTAGHLCIRDRDEHLLFTGDHVLPTIHAGLGLGGQSATNPIADYIDSLQRLEAYDDHEVLPGHEHRFRGLARRCATSAEHHLRRAREVQEVLGRRPASSVWDTARSITWSRGWDALEGYHAVSALAQTEMHIEFVRSDAGARRLRG